MDEPLSNLDAKLRTTMRGEIKRLQKRLATTTLYVTHDQAEAMTMADLVAVLRDGELQQLGPPDEIYDRPANRFVAAFVGNPPMNVLEGELDGDGQSFVVGGSRLALPASCSARAPPRARACSASGPRTSWSFPPTRRQVELGGEIYVVEPMGNETLVDVRIGEQRLMARAAREFDAAIGSPIGVRVSLESACFFRAEGATALHRSDRASERMETVGMTGRDAARQPRAARGPALSRRALLKASLAGAPALAAVPLLGGMPAYAQAEVRRPPTREARDRRVRGRRADPFKQKIIPLFKKQTGISIQFLEAPYDAFFSKAFQDGQSKAGQYDIYIMDDPWIPQYAAAGILEDLGQHGIDGDAGFAKPFIDLGYWPPRSGPRIKGFESKKPALVALPTIGDLQTLTYRNDIYKRRRRRGPSSSRSARRP